jgi:DNA-binding CsgD family transcriptional regulator
MNLSDRYTYEQLSERSSLDDRPVSRLFCCEVKVDRRTLKTGLGQFYIKLQLNLSFSQLKRLVEDSFMTRIPLLVKDDFEYFRVPTQVKSLDSSAVNHVLTHIANEVAGLLQYAYLVRADDSNRACTIAIRAVAPEYMQIIAAEPLTVRELEVLQLIVDGHDNSAISGKLYITTGTVKTHVRSALRKLCANNRTQAAIRALRSGLVR